ncbi:MAG: hypothetical protein AAGI23_09460 [Bacteroidota bacterium]
MSTKKMIGLGLIAYLLLRSSGSSNDDSGSSRPDTISREDTPPSKPTRDDLSSNFLQFRSDYLSAHQRSTTSNQSVSGSTFNRLVTGGEVI